MFWRKKKQQVECTKYPDFIANGVCEKCAMQKIPPWIAYETQRYCYDTCRNDIVMVLKRDMHPECAEKAIEAFDKENEWVNPDV